MQEVMAWLVAQDVRRKAYQALAAAGARAGARPGLCACVCVCVGGGGDTWRQAMGDEDGGVGVSFSKGACANESEETWPLVW